MPFGSAKLGQNGGRYDASVACLGRGLRTFELRSNTRAGRKIACPVLGVRASLVRAWPYTPVHMGTWTHEALGTLARGKGVGGREFICVRCRPSVGWFGCAVVWHKVGLIALTLRVRGANRFTFAENELLN